MMAEHELGGKLLAGVSRSFYLTLKALPAGLREPLSIAYLLARTADTIADTAAIDAARRMDLLREFDELAQKAARDEAEETVLQARLQAEFIPQQTDVDEAELLARLIEIFTALHQLPESQQVQIREVLRPIVRGQLLDIERFPADGQVRALANAGELDEYTWLVAGCVGDFWTRLTASTNEKSFTQDTMLGEMIERGVRLGKGLQLVNILRDVGKDLSMGRCYFPLDELQAQNLSPVEIAGSPAKLAPVCEKWQKLCREHLLCGVDYIESLQQKRMRYAVALPLLLGLKTLNQIEAATWDARLRGIKVTRGDVGRVLFDAGLAVLRRGGLRKLTESVNRGA